MVYYIIYTWYINDPIHGILYTLSIIFKSKVFATFQKKCVLKKSNVFLNLTFIQSFCYFKKKGIEKNLTFFLKSKVFATFFSFYLA
jgi:hypothetical protein